MTLFLSPTTSGTEKQAVAYDYARRLARGELACQVGANCLGFLHWINLLNPSCNSNNINMIVQKSLKLYLTEAFNPLNAGSDPGCV